MQKALQQYISVLDTEESLSGCRRKTAQHVIAQDTDTPLGVEVDYDQADGSLAVSAHIAPSLHTVRD